MGRVLILPTILLLVAGSTVVASDFAPVPTDPALQYRLALTSPAQPQIVPGLSGPRQPVTAPHGHKRHRVASGAGYGYGGRGMPTYAWGHFGAQSRSFCVPHRGYYGHQPQWSFRRGL